MNDWQAQITNCFGVVDRIMCQSAWEQEKTLAMIKYAKSDEVKLNGLFATCYANYSLPSLKPLVLSQKY